MSERELQGRRSFLTRAALAGGAATVAAGAAPVAQAALAEPEESPPERPAPRGYQLTEHVKRYYRLARD